MTHNAKIGSALAMLASAVKCGEAWSPTLQAALDEAKAILAQEALLDSAYALKARQGPIGMTMLLSEVGDDNFGFQNLDHAVKDLDWSAKRGTTRVTFETETTISPSTGLDRQGFVIWMDRPVLVDTMARLRAEREAG